MGLANRQPRVRFGVLLGEDNQQAKHHAEQGDTLDEGGSDDHRGTDVATCLGLAGDTFHSALTDFTDAETGTNSGKAGADTGTEDSYEFCCFSSHFK